MDHVADTIVTDIHLELDGEHLPAVCEVTFGTNESFEFNICNAFLNKHNCIVFTHQVNGNEIYIGTTKETVAFNIVKTLNEKIQFWKARKDRFLKNYYKHKDE